MEIKILFFLGIYLENGVVILVGEHYCDRYKSRNKQEIPFFREIVVLVLPEAEGGIKAVDQCNDPREYYAVAAHPHYMDIFIKHRILEQTYKNPEHHNITFYS